MQLDLLFEFIGTAVLILLGDGVVANVLLKGTKGQNAGWVVITIAWGLAVFVGAYISAPYSGAHLNPAVTIGLAMAGVFKGNVIGYIIAQLLGGFVGACLVYVFYKPHFDVEENKDNKLAVFCTAPAIRTYFYNFICELIGTFMLVFGILTVAGAAIAGPYPVALLIVVIGMSLGGTTGYAINPARDLPPRIAHAILPVKNKRDSDWGYSWIPVIAPMVGGALAAWVYLAIF
ncbi:putative glycerol uptake facilitator protein [Bacteroides pyogenes]|uniref:Aquaporin family protein n=2 Tax=Bacteroides pyogenes TaxID=310300 RepID=A0A5D3EE32_9BACE|nr:MIP/aquaporin family protein [Bacteroides pyogenes]MBR8704422.1 putative glycerol uptake facilitator protein [Bacteroides pyogenes]MBR8708654.1 putative glycerol uptake facilitator protein [Bacteroides pyogenes]MBR8716958.1 putative glycerol uptake facilitator protein [Bacteroides pyogenes]MBR8721646.1 putative glycerol uptake facilitator protein [Bacteroides pyogenes]MBR8725144.1 putative glycerol uptake facilitator protein [Bacteroides pyogenes]